VEGSVVDCPPLSSQWLLLSNNTMKWFLESFATLASFFGTFHCIPFWANRETPFSI
jgi:hypothetical protein